VFVEVGHAVAQLVEAVRYEPEGRGFDSQLCLWNFSLTSLRPHFGPGVDSASKRNEYQEYFFGGKGGRCVGLTTLPPSCADCLKSGSLNLLETPELVETCKGFALPFTFFDDVHEYCRPSASSVPGTHRHGLCV
jgi:hypothetical protein